MQVLLYFCPIQKMLKKWKVVKPPTLSLDSPYTKHSNPHFHTEHRLNWLPHEYINT
jgi:hypothetical protein